ncbi:hypothetical protein NEIELOOT_01242 [Neisseria elongata subsp. glycolytica ATCC 29315]|uniref:Uncharacterized protein n=1 Tax=Neisseria elongata subsp. glycolytica ATCC 29315 TaxID=546263 RepID=D4DQA5_NEIEG|nr:hypothetical protein NEIELOOT_01242 [Neisseria elongata subsp. glycolytica ATCC 29315]
MSFSLLTVLPRIKRQKPVRCKRLSGFGRHFLTACYVIDTPPLAFQTACNMGKSPDLKFVRGRNHVGQGRLSP